MNETCPTELILEFDSAWSPSDIGLDQIAALFPQLDFYLEYCEPMMGFKGSDHWVYVELIGHHFESLPDMEQELEDEPANPEDENLENLEGGISVFAKAERLRTRWMIEECCEILILWALV